MREARGEGLDGEGTGEVMRITGEDMLWALLADVVDNLVPVTMRAVALLVVLWIVFGIRP